MAPKWRMSAHRPNRSPRGTKIKEDSFGKEGCEINNYLAQQLPLEERREYFLRMERAGQGGGQQRYTRPTLKLCLQH